MPGLTFLEAKARVLGAEHVNDPVRKESKEYQEILQLMKISGAYSKTEMIDLQKPQSAPKVELNPYDTRSVNPLRRPQIVIPEKKTISKDEFLSVGVNREAFRIEVLRQKHLRNL